MVAHYRYFTSRQKSLHRKICRKSIAVLFLTTGLILLEGARRGNIVTIQTDDSAAQSSNTIMPKNNKSSYTVKHAMILQDREAPLPAQMADTIRCVVLSDTHGKHWDVDPLPAGDVLIHLGDVANRGSIQHIRSFVGYVKQYRDEFQDIVLLEGNHDRDLVSPEKVDLAKEYQEIGTFIADQVVHVADGRLSILGVSWDACERNDFSKAEQQFASQGTKQIDMLLTHCPPRLYEQQLSSTIGAPVHLFGHIHRQRGVVAFDNDNCLRINCSSIPANRPVVIDWDPKNKQVVMVKF